MSKKKLLEQKFNELRKKINSENFLRIIFGNIFKFKLELKYKKLIKISVIFLVLIFSGIFYYSSQRYIPREIINMSYKAIINYEGYSDFHKFVTENSVSNVKTKRLSTDMINFWKNYRIKIDDKFGSCTPPSSENSFDYDNDGESEIFAQCDFEFADNENYYRVFFEKNKDGTFHVENISAGFPKFHINYKNKNYIISELGSEDSYLAGYSIEIFSNNKLLEEVLVRKNFFNYFKPEINYLDSDKYKPFAQEISKRLILVNDNIEYLDEPTDYFVDEKFQKNRSKMTMSRFNLNEWGMMDTDISHNWFEKFGGDIYFVIWGRDIFRNYFAHIFLVENNKKIGKKVAKISLNEVAKKNIEVKHFEKSFEILTREKK
ncbi:MAG: hypothetical protein ACRCSK_00145 [Fusobacteriaceae bacterium]